MHEIGRTLREWLSTDELPGDLYELLGVGRFAPAEERLDERIQTRYAELLPYQNHSDAAVVRRVVRFQRELGRAADLIAHPVRLRAHHAAMLTRLQEQYAGQPAASTWSEAELVSWLGGVQHVHPLRVWLVAAALAGRGDQAARESFLNSVALPATGPRVQVPEPPPWPAKPVVNDTPATEMPFDFDVVASWESTSRGRKQKAPARGPAGLRKWVPLGIGLGGILLIGIVLLSTGTRGKRVVLPAPTPVLDVAPENGGDQSTNKAKPKGMEKREDSEKSHGAPGGSEPSPPPRPAQAFRCTGVLEKIQGRNEEIHLLVSSAAPFHASGEVERGEFVTTDPDFASSLDDYLSEADRECLAPDRRPSFRPDQVVVEGEALDAASAPSGYRLHGAYPLAWLKSITRAGDPGTLARPVVRRRQGVEKKLCDVALCDRIHPRQGATFSLTGLCRSVTPDRELILCPPPGNGDYPSLRVRMGIPLSDLSPVGQLLTLRLTVAPGSSDQQLLLLGSEILARSTPAGRDMPLSHVPVAKPAPAGARSVTVEERNKWFEAMDNPEQHVGARLQGRGICNGIDTGPPATLRLQCDAYAGILHIPWRSNAAREAFLQKLAPSERIEFEVVVQGRASELMPSRAKLELCWIARQSAPSEKIEFAPGEAEQAAGAELRTINNCHNSQITVLAWNYDGRYIATASESDSLCNVKVWDASSGVAVASTSSPPMEYDFKRRIKDFAWHPGRNEIAIVAHSIIWTWTIGAAGTQRPLAGQKYGEFASIDWCGGGKEVAFSCQPGFTGPWMIVIGNPAGGNTRNFGPLGSAEVNLRAARKGRLLAVAAGSGGTPMLLNSQSLVRLSLAAAASKQSHSAPAVLGSLRSFAWCPSQPWLAIVGEKVQVWDVSRERFPKLKREWGAFSGAESRISWSPEGTHLAIAGGPGGISVWEVESGKLVNKFAEREIVYSLAWSPDQEDSSARLAAGDFRGNLHIYRVFEAAASKKDP
jgi:WD40 repeat protein